MITDAIRAAIKVREATNDEWDYGVEKCRNEEIRILTQDVNETIYFLDHDCTATEFSWISEIFDELVEITKSHALVECFYRVAAKFPDESVKYHIIEQIKMSEGFLNQ